MNLTESTKIFDQFKLIKYKITMLYKNFFQCINQAN